MIQNASEIWPIEPWKECKDFQGSRSLEFSDRRKSNSQIVVDRLRLTSRFGSNLPSEYFSCDVLSMFYPIVDAHLACQGHLIILFATMQISMDDIGTPETSEISSSNIIIYPYLVYDYRICYADSDGLSIG